MNKEGRKEGKKERKKERRKERKKGRKKERKKGRKKERKRLCLTLLQMPNPSRNTKHLFNSGQPRTKLIKKNPVVVLVGETGSGKTTQ